MTGRDIRKARKARGLPLAQVADRFGVSVSTVYAWERGRRVPPQLVDALKYLLAIQ